MKIRESILQNNIYAITVDNFIKELGAFNCIGKTIDKIATTSQIFLGHYRVDGFNLSLEQEKEYGKRILDFFEANGEFYIVNSFGIKPKKIGEGLVACHCHNNSAFHEMIEIILNYFGETIIFSPKKEWDEFIKFHRNYMRHSAESYIIEGYTDILLLYNDSGDLTVMFNLDFFSVTEIKKILSPDFL